MEICIARYKVKIFTMVFFLWCSVTSHTHISVSFHRAVCIPEFTNWNSPNVHVSACEYLPLPAHCFTTFMNSRKQALVQWGKCSASSENGRKYHKICSKWMNGWVTQFHLRGHCHWVIWIKQKLCKLKTEGMHTFAITTQHFPYLDNDRGVVGGRGDCEKFVCSSHLHLPLQGANLSTTISCSSNAHEDERMDSSRASLQKAGKCLVLNQLSNVAEAVQCSGETTERSKKPSNHPESQRV